jgi:hypothetical protein
MRRHFFPHVAEYQGRIVADNILGRERAASYAGIPRVVFADPEIGAVGLTAGSARQRGIQRGVPRGAGGTSLRGLHRYRAVARRGPNHLAAVPRAPNPPGDDIDAEPMIDGRLRRGVDASWTSDGRGGGRRWVSRASTTWDGGIDFSYRFGAAA